MTATASALPLSDSQALGERAGNPWVIGLTVVIPTFMVAVDQTITNVALRYIVGGLSAASDDGQWVVTSYLVATAIVMPLTGWLSAVLGRRDYLLMSVMTFTIASALCGMARSLPELIAFRCLQGLAGAAMLPLAQGVLLDAFPRSKAGHAMAIYSFAVVMAPIVGPTLGGWITVNYSWRWIFYINVPLGMLALPLCYRLVVDPPYIRQQTESIWSRPLRVDGIGLGLVVLGLSCLEVLNSKGQEWDWFGDPFWRVQWLAVGAVIGIGGLIAWSLLRPDAIVDVRVFRDRNFWVANTIGFGLLFGFFGGMVTFPTMLQTLFNYDALNAGIVMSPGGAVAMVGLVVATVLQARGFDARWLIAAGLIVMALGFWLLTRLDLDAGPWQVLVPYALVIGGVLTAFGPLCSAAFQFLPVNDRPKATGMFALIRMEAGSFGSALLIATLIQRRMQFHLARMTDHLTPLDPNLNSMLDQSSRYYQQFVGDPVQSELLASQTIDNIRQQQAGILSYIDSFYVCFLLTAATVPLVLLMRRSVLSREEAKKIEAAT